MFFFSLIPFLSPNLKLWLCGKDKISSTKNIKDISSGFHRAQQMTHISQLLDIRKSLVPWGGEKDFYWRLGVCVFILLAPSNGTMKSLSISDLCLKKETNRFLSIYTFAMHCFLFHNCWEYRLVDCWLFVPTSSQAFESGIIHHHLHTNAKCFHQCAYWYIGHIR